MQLSVLGPLVLSEQHRSHTPSAPKQRQLLALLALNAGSVVSVDVCLDELWEGDPPESASTTLQTYVLQLRRRLAQMPSVGSAAKAKSVLATQGRGYVLGTREQTDVARYALLVSRAREASAGADWLRAALGFREALQVWRGEVLTDVQTGPQLKAWATGLELGRLSVLEERIDADLKLGIHLQLMEELASLCAMHPMHERFHAQLMLAQYRSGQRAAALGTYHSLRRTLLDGLGIDPSDEIQRLHNDVLQGAPGIGTPAGSAGRSDVIQLWRAEQARQVVA